MVAAEGLVLSRHFVAGIRASSKAGPAWPARAAGGGFDPPLAVPLNFNRAAPTPSRYAIPANLTGLTMIAAMVEGDEVLAMYQVHTRGFGTLLTASHFTVNDGMIHEERIVFDTRGEPAASRRYRELLKPAGIRHEARAVLRSRGVAWGALTLLRSTEHGFGARELRWLATVSRAVATGLGPRIRP